MSLAFALVCDASPVTGDTVLLLDICICLVVVMTCLAVLTQVWPQS